MKLATFIADGQSAAIGIVVGETVFDLAQAARRDGVDAAPFASMQALIDAGPAGLDLARSILARRSGDGGLDRALGEVALLAPLPVPMQIRDFTNFPAHIRRAPVGMRRLAARLAGAPDPVPNFDPAAPIPEMFRAQPHFFKCNRFNVVGPGADVVWPAASVIIDYEIELGMIIGTKAKNVSPGSARQHVFGYTIYNDFSARDLQLVEMRGNLGPSKSKDFDTGNVLGPWIVTADEIPDPQDLDMTARINGEIWSNGNSRDIIHSFDELIAFASRDETLYPGELFGSGTLGGGSGLEQDRFLTPGDVVDLTVERIGTLTNRVVRGS